ncbi:MAG: ATP-binding protein [Pseudomonadota bacterium]|nr:ATP-binding protein [Pseudomonadota bacterium]
MRFDPRRYLVLAAAAVMLSWAAVCGLVYGSADRLRMQRQDFDLLTQQSLAVEQMRSAVLELGASGDEYMMLATLNRTDPSQPREQIGSDFGSKITVARDKFRISFARFKWLLQGQSSNFEAATMAASNPADVGAIHGKYDAYLAASAALHELAGTQADLSHVKKVKGEQKAREILLLAELNERLTDLRKTVGSKNPRFESLVLEMRDQVLLLIVLAILPALVTGVLAFRGIIGLFRKISAQKDDIARANGYLERALGELRRVQQTLVETEQLSTLGKLTATVSHQLRKPMAAVRSSLSLIRQSANDPQQLLPSLDRAESSIVRCDNIVGDLLEYTRSRRIELKQFDLSQWMVKVLAERIVPSETILNVDLSSHGAVVMIDEDRLRRVAVNLVQNAVEAIASSKGKGEVSIQTGIAGEHAYLEVSDTGEGIAPDVLPHIFEPLFTTKSAGTGLGLAIAKQVVEQHEGRIVVNSKVGVGTSVQVLLPLATVRKDQAA